MMQGVKRPEPMPRWWRLGTRTQGLFFVMVALSGLVGLTTRSLAWGVITAIVVGSLAALLLWRTGGRT